MLLGRRKTRARWNPWGVALPVALLVLFVAAYLAATVMQAVELLR